MNTRIKNRLIRPLALALAVSTALAPGAYTPIAAAQSYGSEQEQPAFAQQELDQMLAPIALYPDSLLSQVLMAATYPLEVVQAARWSRANPHLRGDDAVRAVESEDWDPSVKSLVAFPQILDMMDRKLDWTERLGDAFLAQEPQVMATVQDLRQRAYAAGNLRSDDRIRVTSQDRVIVVEPAQPEVVYVPYYNPVVVYGRWWWPDYPPVYWAPWPGYYARPGLAANFFWGTGIALSAGFFFGGFDWHRHHARVANVHSYYYNRPVVFDRDRHVTRVTNINVTPGEWRHDPGHRRGAPYRTVSLRQRFEADSRRDGRERNATAIINNRDERRDGRWDARERNDNRPDGRDTRGPTLRSEANAGARSAVQERNDQRRDAPTAVTRPEPTVTVRPDWRERNDHRFDRDARSPTLRSEANSGARPAVQEREQRREAPAVVSRPEPTTIVRPDGRERGGNRPDLRDARGPGFRNEAHGRPDVRSPENNSRFEARERNNQSEVRASPAIRAEARVDTRPEPRRVEVNSRQPAAVHGPARRDSDGFREVGKREHPNKREQKG